MPVYLSTFIMALVLSTDIVMAQNILSKPTSSEFQCIQWLKDKNAEQDLIDLVPFIFKESIKAGVDPTLVIAQTSLETNYFKSSLSKNFKNTAGIKNRYNSNEYAFYNSYEDGLKAQIAHLALYAGNPQEWYTYKSWLDGKVKTIEELTGVWAEDIYYDKKLKKMINEIYSYESECIPITNIDVEPINKPKTNKLHEILNKKINKIPSGIDIINKIIRRNIL